ncbi:MAG: hypothetical protein IKF14_11725 [Atopobiaceae bacterium]|nr:hypothetical protein [Atopobiaceae bacterium]
MKTSMLGGTQRRALVARWSEVVSKGVADEGGNALSPGDVVRLPAHVRWAGDGEWDAPGTVTGYAIGKDGAPCVVVDAPAHNGRRPDTWRTWIVDGDYCNKIEEDEAAALAADVEKRCLGGRGAGALIDAETRAMLSQSWMQVMLGGVSTKGGVAVQPGDLVRLPRNVARNRGSQLHAAGLCLGFAVGLDGSPCVVADAVGEDVPELTRWRTWVVRGAECLVIDSKEAWRLEAMYDRSGRLKPRGHVTRGKGK